MSLFFDDWIVLNLQDTEESFIQLLGDWLHSWADYFGVEDITCGNFIQLKANWWIGNEWQGPKC